MIRRALLVSLLLASALASRRARAQLSVTSTWTYDLSVLTGGDWRGLGANFWPQAVRGSLALVFPDDRAPITDPREVERWVVSGRPLRAVAFPGVTGDAAAAWSLAKQVGRVNQQQDGRAAPVLAVNSGWTDWWAATGHAVELASLRPAIDAGRAFGAEPVSGRVADLLRRRLKVHHGQVGLVGHSAGGYYSANVAWLLGARERDQVAVYNIGLAAKLPPKVRGRQLVGASDTLALVNSSADALTQRSTQIEPGLSHLGGPLWRIGDSLSDRRWEIAPLAQLFSGARTKRPGAPVARSARIRSWAEELSRRAAVAHEVAQRNRSSVGASGVLSIKLEHDATLLKLAAERATALADLQQARQRRDAPAEAAAKRQLVENRAQRQAAAQRLQQAQKVPRDYGTDTVQFVSMLTSETMATSFSPWRAWEKAVKGSLAAASWGEQWRQVWMSNPLINPGEIFRSSPPPLRQPVDVHAPRRRSAGRSRGVPHDRSSEVIR